MIAAVIGEDCGRPGGEVVVEGSHPGLTPTQFCRGALHGCPTRRRGCVSLTNEIFAHTQNTKLPRLAVWVILRYFLGPAGCVASGDWQPHGESGTTGQQRQHANVRRPHPEAACRGPESPEQGARGRVEYTC